MLLYPSDRVLRVAHRVVYRDLRGAVYAVRHSGGQRVLESAVSQTGSGMDVQMPANRIAGAV